MTDTVNTATIKVVADASGVEAGLRPAVEAARRTEQAISQVGNGAAASTGKVEAASRGIVASIQRTTAAMEAGGRETAAYYEAIARQRGIDPATLAPYIAKLREAERAQAGARTGLNEFGVSAGQTAAALRQLPPQLTDIFTQLAGGQNPLLVLIQQGGQIKDSFGGAGNAIDAIGGQIKSLFASLTGGAESIDSIGNTLSNIGEGQSSLAQSAGDAAAGVNEVADAANTLAEAGGSARTALSGVQIATGVVIGGAVLAAAALGALAYAHYKGSLEAGIYTRALIMSGNAAGATVDQLSEASRQIAVLSGSRGAAMEAVNALVATGQVSADMLKEYGSLAVDVQKVVGRSVQETADDFASLGESPLEALDKIDKKYHIITASTYLQVKALQDQGKASEAADLAQQAYADGIQKQRQQVLDSLTDWERGWIRIKGAVSGAIDAVIDFAAGRETTSVEKINSLLGEREAIEARIASLRKRGAARDGGSYDPDKDPAVASAKAELDANERSINVIRDKEKAQRDAAKAKAESQKVDDAQKQWAKDADQFLGRVTQRENEIKVAREQGAAAHLKSKEIEDRVAAIRVKYADTYNGLIESNIAALKRQDQVADAIAQRELARIAAQQALGSITEESAINKTAEVELRNIDRDIASAQQELAQIRRKVSAAPGQKTSEINDKEAELAKLREERAGREERRQNDLLILDQKRTQASDELYNKGLLAATAERDGLVESLGAQLDYSAGVGLTKLQLAELNATRLESIAGYKEERAAALEALEPGNATAKMYREQAQALRDTASAGIGGAARDSAQELKDFLDPTKAETFGEALRNAFGVAGDSLTKLTGSLKEFGARQLEIEKKRGDAAWSYLNGKKTEEEYLKDITALNERSTQSQLAGYGDMASAAAGFFGEHSRGYQSLMAVSQVFHAAELAMTTAELVPKAISAVLSQGQGDPYTAFGRMAAMAAIVAGLGVAIGGIGGGGADTTAADRQKANGTGSILGDKDAQSESIARSLEAIEKASYQDLTINSSMLTVLRSIDSGINGVSNLLYRTDGFSTEAPGTQLGSAASFASSGLGLDLIFAPVFGRLLDSLTGGFLGKIAGKVGNAIFGGNVHTLDTGITLDKGSLAQILAGGANVSQYADTKKDGGWFHSDKYSTSTADLGAEIDSQFTLIFGGMHDAILQSASVLGISGDVFNQRLDSFVVDLGKISTKDMKPEEVQKALQTAISKVGDDLAKFAVDGIQQFQNAGEGALETLTRIATEYQTVDVVFQSFGKTFGQVGLASVAARDRLIDLAGGLDKFTSQGEYFLTNFFTEQEQAAALKKRIDPTLAQYGLTTEGEGASKALRDFIVGLDTTTESGAQAYTALMAIAPAFKAVTDAQQDALDQRKDLQSQFDELTMSEEQLATKRRDAIAEVNRPLYDLVQAAQAAKNAIEAQAQTQTSLLELQGQIYDLIGDKAGAAAVLQQQHAAALAALDPALRGATQYLWDLQAAAKATEQVKADASVLLGGVDTAFSVLQKVVSREKDLLQKRIDSETEAVSRLKSLTDTISSTLDGMNVSGADAIGRQAAQAQIKAALASVKGGAQLSDDQIKSLGKALGAVSQDSSKQFGSKEDYLFDFLTTRNDIAQLGDLTGDQLSAEEKALEQLQDQSKALDDMLAKTQDQIDILKGISTTGLSIEQALYGVQTAIVAAQQNSVAAAASAIAKAYQDALGRNPDSAGMEFWQNQAAAGTSIGAITGSIKNSSEAQVRNLYQDLLGRSADAGGLSFFLKSGASLSEIAAAIKNSDEYKKLHGIPGFAGGGAFGGGLRIVGENGPELEATGPSRIWSSNQTAALLARASSPDGNSAALAEAVRDLKSENAKQRGVIETMAKDMAAMATILKGVSPNGTFIKTRSN